MEAIGWIGTACFTVIGLPILRTCYVTKAVPYDWGFLALWCMGSSFSGVYAYHHGSDALIPNYIINTMVSLTVMRMKWAYAKKVLEA